MTGVWVLHKSKKYLAHASQRAEDARQEKSTHSAAPRLLRAQIPLFHGGESPSCNGPQEQGPGGPDASIPAETVEHLLEAASVIAAVTMARVLREGFSAGGLR